MKKRRVTYAVVLAVSLVVVIGFLSASAIVTPAACDCYGGCYYCRWDEGSQSYHCQVYDGPGACFCDTDGCILSRLICCKAN